MHPRFQNFRNFEQFENLWDGTTSLAEDQVLKRSRMSTSTNGLGELRRKDWGMEAQQQSARILGVQGCSTWGRFCCRASPILHRVCSFVLLEKPRPSGNSTATPWTIPNSNTCNYRFPPGPRPMQPLSGEGRCCCCRPLPAPWPQQPPALLPPLQAARP